MGNLTVIGTWYQTGGSWRPCLVIHRTGDESNGQLVPCIVGLEHAWIWDERIGDPRACARTAAGFLQALRMDGRNIRNHFKLRALIHDHLGDLIGIPPWTPPAQTVIAEVTVTNKDTGKAHEVELTDV